jgi:glyoxylase-like metal-dependent hydrolase (beta-lactamase superfamily II)
MALDYRIISIGTLAANPLWDERAAVRTGHATTTLITAGAARIIVDPGLPPQALHARLGERCRVRPEEITHVFLTSFQPDHRRGVTLFQQAVWMLAEAEREAAVSAIRANFADAESAGDLDLSHAYRHELDVLQRTRAAPDSIVRGVDLFPLPGVTPGTCGLLLALPALTVLACGDAIATAEHLDQATVLPDVADLERAQESLREAVQIADVIIPGRDNVILNPVRRLM